MPWVRIDDRYSEHPKIIAGGPLAVALQIRALCYCARNLTDGKLSRGIVAMMTHDLGDFGAADMERVGLWDRTSDGWVVHDYLEYNPSRKRIESERASISRRVRRFRDNLKQTRNAVINAAPVPDPVPDPDPVPKTRSRTTRKQPTAPDGASGSDGFAQFWTAYPRHIGMDRAQRAFRGALKRGVTLVQMLDALHRQKADRQALERLGKFVPAWAYPATWLNGSRWQDEPLTATVEPPEWEPPEVRGPKGDTSGLAGFFPPERKPESA